MTDHTHAERQRRYRERQKSEQEVHETVTASLELLLTTIQRQRAMNADSEALLDLVEGTLTGLTATDLDPEETSERHVTEYGLTFDEDMIAEIVKRNNKLIEEFAAREQPVSTSELVERLGGLVPAAIFRLCVAHVPWANWQTAPSRDAEEES